MDTKKTILIVGATGYVGGRLLNKLDKINQYQIKCLARNPESIDTTKYTNVEVIKGDLLNKPETITQHICDTEIVFFLAHSLGEKKDFVKKEHKIAKNFAKAAKAAKIKKIIFLGGLGKGENLSPHLKSRHEVGKILLESEAIVIEFRASIILGSGSLSFDMIRSLTEKLPFMITPKWVSSLAQPISIRNILEYLTQAIDSKYSRSQIYEIGGTDIASYGELMQEYARQRNLKRAMIKVPFLTPWLSSLWLGLVTPVYARIGRKLIESLTHDTIVTNDKAFKEFDIKLISYKSAIAKAIENEDKQIAETFWFDSISSGGSPPSYGGVKFKSRVVDYRERTVPLSKEKAFLPIQKIGGKTGWYHANFLWRLRGFIDLLFGGVGLRRGRKHPTKIKVGDPIDFWRVEEFKKDSTLFLKAEMKVPGRAWLKFEVKEEEDNKSIITQTAIFDPLGLFGLIYWYALYPLHGVMFKGMIENIKKEALANKS